MSSKILDTTTLSSNFRINLPSDARKILDVIPGNKVIIVYENEQIVVRKA